MALLLTSNRRGADSFLLALRLWAGGRRLAWWALWLALSLAGAGVVRAEREVTIQLKWHHQFQFAGYYAAQLKGYYAEEGLDVTLREGAPDRPVLPTVLEGRADFGVSDADVLLARLRGEPVVACAAIFQHSPYIVLSRADRGIRRPSDLVGARIMVSDTQGRAQLVVMLGREGVPLNQVTLLPHSWDLRDLVDGRVDAVTAYSTVEPARLREMAVTPSQLRAVDYGVDFYGDTLFTTEDFARRHHDTTEAVIRATLRGWDYAMDHPQELIAYILTLPGVNERGVTPQHLQTEAAEMRRLVLADVVNIGHMNPARWERMAQTFRDTGVVTGNADSLGGFMFEPSTTFDRRRMLALLWSLATLAFLACTVALWNLQLRRKVDHRTRQVRQSERKLQALLDNTTSLLGLVSPEGRLLEVNRTALNFAGVPRDQVVGQWIWDTSWWNHCAEQRDLLRRSVIEVAHTGRPARFEATHLDAEGRMRDVDFALRPVRDGDGRIECLIAEGLDVTERHAAITALLESEQVTRLVIEGALDAVVGIDQRGLVSHWNAQAERTFGWTREEALGRPVADMVPEAAATQQRASAEPEGPSARRIEVAARRRDGSFFPAEMSVTTVSLGAGRMVNVFIRDLTDQRRLEEQFRQSQKMEAIGQLAGGVAHDFNNLLTVIQGNASLMQMAGDSPETTRTSVAEILAAGERASGLTRQLLAFSRQQPMQAKNLDVRDLIANLSRMLRRLIGEHITFSTACGDDPLPVYGDPGMLEQILLNLAVNARDAMPGGGCLNIAATPLTLAENAPELPPHITAGPFVRLDIADTGTGIAPEHLPHIFEPFFTTKEVGKGTGLGLATVFGIAQQHGGWVTVESELGRGTTFAVWLPMRPESVEEATKVEAARPRHAQAGHETILLVEDEEMVRYIVRHTLTRHGYKVHEAMDGPAALAQWKQIGHEVDLLLTDMVMPGGMSGHELARQLTEMAHGQLKVIYTSGYTPDIFDAEYNLPEGITFLSKPYRAEDLLAAVRQSFDGMPA